MTKNDLFTKRKSSKPKVVTSFRVNIDMAGAANDDFSSSLSVHDLYADGTVQINLCRETDNVYSTIDCRVKADDLIRLGEVLKGLKI